MKKDGIYGYYTGNTVRKRPIELYRRQTSGKGIAVTNLRYYNSPKFEEILTRLQDKAHGSETAAECADIYEIRHWISYFADLNQDISDGLFSRHYIPTTCEDYTEEIVSAIKYLISYEGRIHSGELDLGLDLKHGVEISVTVYEYGDLTDVGRQKYTFSTNKSHKSLCDEYMKEEKKSRKMIWHNQHLRDIQRPANVTGRYVIEEPDLEYVLFFCS